MNKPSKKQIKASLDQLKSPPNEEGGKPMADEKGHHLSPKMANRRIRQNKV